MIEDGGYKMFISEIIHSALVVLGELAAKGNDCAISPAQIACEHNIPQKSIDKAVARLSDMGLVHILTEDKKERTSPSRASLRLAKHPDEVYVADVIKHFYRDDFSGAYQTGSGEKLPQSHLTRCINQLKWQGEQFVEVQMRGVSLNVLATWSSLKKEPRLSNNEE